MDDDDSDEHEPDGDAEQYGFCDTPDCIFAGEHFYPSECETVEDAKARDAYHRREHRRQRWPRFYAVVEAVAYRWDRLWRKRREPIPIDHGDDSIPF